MVAAWIVVGVPLIAQLALSRESPAGKEGFAEQDKKRTNTINFDHILIAWHIFQERQAKVQN